MSIDFKSELDALLDAKDEKKTQQLKTILKAKNKSNEFMEAFKKVVEDVIRPALDKIKKQLDERESFCRVEEYEDAIHKQISICFDVPPDQNFSVSDLHKYSHVSFFGDIRDKNVQIHKSTITKVGSSSGGPEGNLKLDKVTEKVVESKVMDVLKKIYR